MLALIEVLAHLIEDPTRVLTMNARTQALDLIAAAVPSIPNRFWTVDHELIRNVVRSAHHLDQYIMRALDPGYTALTSQPTPRSCSPSPKWTASSPASSRPSPALSMSCSGALVTLCAL